jgi:hydroxyethylthiazole kinase-like uncharacterized protein yjeF
MPASMPPCRVPGAAHAQSLHDTRSSRVVEAAAQATLPPGTLMRRAAHAVTKVALALAPHAKRVWVLTGPGGNGGDGLHAAAQLQQAGREVTVTLLGDAQRMPADARAGLDRARAAGVTVLDRLPAAADGAGPDVALDALLGLGAQRPPEGAYAAAIERFDSLAALRLAVDLPSGLDPDTGQPLGEAVVHAHATITLLTCKPGLFTGAGRDCAGEVWFDPLGTCADDLHAPTSHLSGTADWLAARAPRRHVQHKGSFGDVVVVGGAPGMVGAARLAAHAALAAGAGRTIVSLLDETAPMFDAHRPEWLWRRAAWLPGAAALEDSTVVCGCGGGDAVRAALPALLARSARLVLDADALNAVATDESLQRQLAARAGRGAATVLTPHPLEAARLLGTTAAAVQADRLRAATSLAGRLRAVVVLKGSGTVVAAPGQVPTINGTGSAALATGGTGDVLAGWIGGQWSGLGSMRAADAQQCARRAAVGSVWLHGAAADREPGVCLRALDLAESMRALAASMP